MYGFGMIMYQIVTGTTPFATIDATPGVFEDLVFKKNHRPPLDFDEYNRKIKAKPEIKSFIEKCWDVDYLKRPTAKEALDLFTRLEQDAITEKLNTNCCVSYLHNVQTRKDTI